MEVLAGAAGAVRTPDDADHVVPNIREVLVFFTVGVRNEEALFYTDTPPEQIKDLFRAAAEASPRDILKLYNRTGQLLNINAGLEPNTPTTRYAVQVVAAHSCAMLEEHAAVQLQTLEMRIANIERQLKADPPLPDAVRQLQRQVDAFREKLETTESLSWLGFNKQLPMPVSTEECRRLKYRRKSDSIKKQVKMNFANICDSQVSDLVREDLRMPSFDSTQWEDEELLWLLQQMYLDFDLCSKFAVDIETLRNFLYEAYKNYNEVPFHNFRHCFCVAQMMYAICWAVDLPGKVGDLEVLILLTSCICHDLDHPGYNNIYQINAKTELALRYNDISPLENHHCSVAFRILENDDCNLFRSFTSDTFKTIREGIIRSILATDMARHNEILAQFKDTIPCFDYDNKHHVNLLCMVLIKVSDISNEARPMDVAEPWLDKLLMEFFKQSDAEKLEGLPVTPFMDRDRITKPSSQCSFIGFVLLPLFETLAELLTELQDLIVQPVRDALDYYKRLNEATKEERLQRKSIVAELNSGADLSPAQSTGGGSTQGIGKSASNLRLKKSLSFQTNRSRSRSTDTEENMPQPANQSADHDASPTSMTAAPASLGGEDATALSLCLLPEDDNELVLDSDGELDNNEAEEEEEEEDSETNTVTEVEASERALKFKISTEVANATSSSFSGTALLSGCHSNSNIGGRKSYPGSRKGSRERVVISSATNQQQQQSFVHPNYRAPGKLQKTIGTLSFDHQYHHHPQHLQQQDGAVVSQNQVAPSMDRRGSAVSCYSSCIASGGGNNSVVGMVGGRLVFGGGVAGGGGQISKRVADDDDGGGGESCDGDMVADGAKGVVGSATSTGGSNVCVDTSEQAKNQLTSASAATTTTTTTATPTPTTNPPTNSTPSHTKRTTNFLLKLSTLKRQNSNKSSSKIKTTDKSASHNGTDNSIVAAVSPAGPIVDVDNGKAKDNSELPVDEIRNNLECTLRSTNKKQDVIKVDLDGDTDVSTALQQREKIVPSSSTAKSTTAHQSLGSGGSSFLSRFKHFTYDRLGLLSSSGTLDKDHQHHNENVAGQKTATLKNHSLTRMTLPLIRHKHRHVTTTNVTQDASSTYCKSLDNVDQTNQTDHLLTDDHQSGGGHHHQRLHKASTLPKMRKLGFGGKKHWKFFLLGGGGGSKRHSTLARDGGGGGGETVQKPTMVDDAGNKSCAWSSDCDVAISAGKWENVGGGNDNGGSQRSIPSTSTSAHVTMTEYYARVLKKKQQKQQQQNNKVTTTTTRTTTGGIGGGESVVDEQCCRARPTKSPPPPPLPITMAPSLNSRGGNATLMAALPLIIGSAEVATM